MTPATRNSTATETRLHIQDVRLLMAMRLVWLLTLLMVVFIHALAIPAFYQTRLPVAQQSEGVRQLGLTASAYVNINSGLRVLSAIAYLSGAIILFYLRSHNWMAWLFSFFLVLISVIPNATIVFVPLARPELAAIAGILGIISVLVGVVCLYCFPDGRLFPPWAKWLLIPCVGWEIFNIIDALFIVQVAPAQAGFLAWQVPLIPILLGGVLARIYRYKHSSPVERQQTKWVGYGLTFFSIAFILDLDFLAPLLGKISPGLGVLSFLITHSLLNLSAIVLVVCIGIAITRYRLWDINIVIHRTLVYGLVTLILAGFFLGGALVLQALFGSQSGIALAALLLLAGVLFNPVRQRVQHTIDRRIYGFRFDLDQAEAAQKPPEIKNPGLLTGSVLGPYQVLGVLGKGGMGEVYLGQGAGQRVALKILPGDLAQDGQFRIRFEREALTLARLEHPHIVKFFSSGQTDGIYYMALEFVDGRDLSSVLRERGTIPLNEVHPFIAQVSEALDYAHTAGYVHRDIKPSNVMLRPKPDHAAVEAVLMDFGIAKVYDAQTALTGSNVVGTIAYMAPEQILAARDIDRRADVYALGVMVFELLTGELPFKGSAGQILFGHLQQPPPEPAADGNTIPKHVGTAIKRALSKNPAERFQTAGAFAAALLNKPTPNGELAVSDEDDLLIFTGAKKSGAGVTYNITDIV